jgi:hypothetical protein
MRSRRFQDRSEAHGRARGDEAPADKAAAEEHDPEDEELFEPLLHASDCASLHDEHPDICTCGALHRWALRAQRS